MRIDGIELTQGAEIQNVAIGSGSFFPDSPDAGEIFYRNDAGNVGLYIYGGSAWTRFPLVTELAAVAFNGLHSSLIGNPTLATVATTGSFTDLYNVPGLSSVAFTGSYASLTGTPSLATVATSGSYTDLINQPTVQSLGGLSYNQSLIISGDATAPATMLSSGSITLTLSPSGVTAGTYGSTVAVPSITIDAKGRITSANSVTITPANIGAVPASQLGVASGVATLNSSGQLTSSQIPASLIGGLNYQGTWNASTNTPTLTSSVGTKGYYYKVSTAGTTSLNGNTQWNAGDLVVFDGTTWDKIDGLSSEVISVAGRSGAVVLTPTDVSLGSVTNTKQLPFTQTLAHTGDATSPATSLSTGTVALTLAASGVGAGTYNSSATQVSPFTVDAKGRVTSVGSAITITPGWANITGKPTTIAGYGITDQITFTGDATSSATSLSSDSIALTLATTGVTAGMYGSATSVPIILVDAKGRLTSVTTASVTPTGIGAVPASQLGVLNGVATLNSVGQLTASQIPSTLLGAIVYQGTWDASVNSPALTSGTGTKGNYYVVASAGTTAIDGNSQWNIGDWIVFDGTKWDKLDGVSSEVTSINGRVGNVVLASSDVGLGNVTNVQQLPVTQTLTVAGDATSPSTALNSGTITVTLAPSGVAAGTFGSSMMLPVLTIDAKGRVTAASNLAITPANIGALPATLTLTATGDVTAPATSLGGGSIALTLAASGVTAGIYNNSATAHVPLTIDAKGRVTATGAAVTITPAWASITGTPTTLSGYGITDKLAMTGDVTAPATTLSTDTIATTLAASGVTAGTYGTNSAVPVLTIDSKGRTTAASVAQITPASIGAINTNQLGIANGVATLNSSGQLTASQIPSSLVGAVVYEGTWNASTNTPTLASGTGTKGNYYVVATAGTTTIDGVSTWYVGDWIVFDGTKWDKLDGIGGQVVSVNGRAGTIVLTSTDVGLANVSNVQQLPYTQTLVITGDATASSTALNTGSIALTLANSGVTAGAYGSATAVPTITVDAKGRVTSVNVSTITPSGIGALPSTQVLGLTGDVTAPSTNLSTGTIATTLAASGVTAGTYNNSATAITPMTFDSKGRITGTGTAVTITPAWTSLTGVPSTFTPPPATTSSLGGIIVGSGLNISSGTLSAAVTSVAGLTGVVTLTAANVGLGNVTNVQQLPVTQTLVVTGDATSSTTSLSSGTIALTLAASGVTAGTYNNSATTHTPFTVDAKGRVTATGTPVTLTPAWASITGLPATFTPPIATSSILGGVMVGVGLSVNGSGVLSLPAATNSTIGGIIAGSGLTMTGSTASLTPATNSAIGGVIAGAGTVMSGSNITVAAATTTTIGGFIAGTGISMSGSTATLAAATASNIGGITVGSGLSVTAGGLLSANVTSVAGRTGAIVLTNADVGLANVTNTQQLAYSQTLAATGDATAPATALNTGTIALTLASSGVTAGTYGAAGGTAGSASAVPVITVDAKGRVTAASTAVINDDIYIVLGTLKAVTGTAWTASGMASATLVSGASYTWEFGGAITSSKTTAGVGLRIVSSTGSGFSQIYGRWDLPYQDTNGNSWSYSQNTETTSTIATAFPTANTYFSAGGRGAFTVGAGTNISALIQVVNDSTSGTTTLAAGAYLKLRRFA